MYKSRITAWGLQKNNKVRDARAILKHQRAVEATGGRCLFFKRGRPIDLEAILRTWRRAGRKYNDDTTYGIPADIECIVFPHDVPTMTNTDAFDNLRTFLHYTAVYFDSCFDTEIWRSVSEDEDLETCTKAETLLVVRTLDDLDKAFALFSKCNNDLAGAYCRRAFASFPEVLSLPYEDLIFELLSQLASQHGQKAAELKQLIINAMTQFASVTLPRSHPYRRIFSSLSVLPQETMQALLEIHGTQRRQIYLQRLGGNHVVIIWNDILRNCEQVHFLQELKMLGCSIDEEIAHIHKTYGASSRRSHLLLMERCKQLHDAGDWIDEEIGLAAALHKIEEAPFPDCEWNLVRLRYNLGVVQTLLEKKHQARSSWNQALALTEKTPYLSDYWSFGLLSRLRRLSMELGDEQSAWQYRHLLDKHNAALIHADRAEQDRINAVIPD